MVYQSLKVIMHADYIGIHFKVAHGHSSALLPVAGTVDVPMMSNPKYELQSTQKINRKVIQIVLNVRAVVYDSQSVRMRKKAKVVRKTFMRSGRSTERWESV